MWQNYMIVCMDVGEYAEAVRALGRVVEELSDKQGADAVDVDVLDYLVDAVVRPETVPEPPAADKEGTTSPANPNEIVQSPNSGRGLYPRVADLFTRTILPRISSSPRVFRAYGKLLVWKKGPPGSDWAHEAIDAYMNAYRASVVADEEVETDLDRWRVAVGEVEDLIQVLRTLAPDVEAKGGGATGVEAQNSNGHGGARQDFNWQFQARSILRSFMARTKRTFGDEAEWEKLPELLESLKGGSSS